MEAATETCSLKIAAHKFWKYKFWKEGWLILLAKSFKTSVSFFSDTAGREPSILLKNEQFHWIFSTILPTLNGYFEHICMSASEVTQML